MAPYTSAAFPVPVALHGDHGGMEHGDMNHGDMGHGGMSHDMGGMGHGGMDMGGGSKCNLSMLGNWNTLHTCFLTSSWSISTHAEFAGTCIGVACWVILSECIRRWAREYDRYIITNAIQDIRAKNEILPERWAAQQYQQDLAEESKRTNVDRSESYAFPMNIFAAFFSAPQKLTKHELRIQPTFMQQFIRAVLYAIQFTSAYLLMLVAMSFNGYVILSMVLGALIGHFATTWDTLGTISTSALYGKSNAKTESINKTEVDNNMKYHDSGVCMNMI